MHVPSALLTIVSVAWLSLQKLPSFSHVPRRKNIRDLPMLLSQSENHDPSPKTPVV